MGSWVDKTIMGWAVCAAFAATSMIAQAEEDVIYSKRWDCIRDPSPEPETGSGTASGTDTDSDSNTDKDTRPCVGKHDPHYNSPLSHGYKLPVMPADTPELKGMQLEMYQSETEDGVGFEFQCPGESVMTGLKSVFEFTKNGFGNRRFSFRCTFLDDAKTGKPIQKKKCSYAATPENEKNKDGHSACNGVQVIGGFKAKDFPDKDDEYKHDRGFTTQCCELSGPTQAVKIPTDCSKKTFDYMKASFEYQCAEGRVIGRIGTIYNADKNDRKYEIHCCKISY